MGNHPSKPDPSAKMEVIGVGYSRTGTMSVTIALERLLKKRVVHGGSNCFSGESSYFRIWVQSLEAKQAGEKELALKGIREVTKGYAACTDVPHILAVPEMLELYPDAKVVLVTRDPDRWWTSIQPLISSATPWYVTPLTFPMAGLRYLPRFMSVYAKETAMLWEKAGKTPGQYGPELLEIYNQSIIDLVPKDRLLVMDIKDGWGPLCRFLGKDIPDEPFPRVNEAEANAAFGRWILLKLVLVWVGILSIVGAGSFTILHLL